MKTPPLDRADNGRLFDDTEDDGFKTPGSLGYWSQGLNIPEKNSNTYLSNQILELLNCTNMFRTTKNHSKNQVYDIGSFMVNGKMQDNYIGFQVIRKLSNEK